VADQGSEGLLSPWLRRKRIAVALPYLRGDILDVGCGSGALAEHCTAGRYTGFDVDAESLAIASRDWPQHAFAAELPNGAFDTIVSLAVIEHIADPAEFLADLARRLRDGPDARIVCTTPRPAFDWIHTLGSAIGIFSSHASEEHETLLDRDDLERAGRAGGLALVEYRRFLFGANQLAVFGRLESAN